MASGTTPTLEEAPAAGQKPRFTGVHADNYVVAYQVCGAFSLKKLARDFGAAADPFSIAEAYAADYREGYRQANFEGCLHRLLNQPAEVRGSP